MRISIAHQAYSAPVQWTKLRSALFMVCRCAALTIKNVPLRLSTDRGVMFLGKDCSNVKVYFLDSFLSSFWEGSEYGKKEYISDKPSQEEIEQVSRVRQGQKNIYC